MVEKVKVASKTWRVAAGTKAMDSLEDLELFLRQQRGLDDVSSEAFFTPVYKRDVYDPHLLLGMEAAIELVYKTREKKQRVLVYGDYDADGMSGTAILVLALQAIDVDVLPFLPDRDDGYGLSRKVLENIAPEVDVVISVDCGVSNVDEIAWLKEQGKGVIVVDHHELPEVLPIADAVLHPRHPDGEYPWESLCGAGMAWKFAQGLLRDKRSTHHNNPDFEKWLLDLALIGTVGDIMPLLGENRAIVQFGLQVMRMGRRPGMRALIDAARLSVNTMSVEDISYRLIPLLNAAGRVGHPQSGLDVLLAPDDKRATERAMKLLALNKERQAITRRITQEASLLLDPEAPVIFATNTDWPAGVVGLVAGQLSSKFGKPAVIVGGNGEHAVGSARSANGMNILEGLRSAQEHAMKLGGHAQAAGFSLAEDKVDDFETAVQDYFSKDRKGTTTQSQSADACIDHGLVGWEAMEAVRKFEPYGEANRKPLFVVKNAAVLDARPVGKTGKHLKLKLALDHCDVEAIGFGLAEGFDDLGDRVDLLGVLDVNEFRGNATLQFRVEDIASAGQVEITNAD